MARFKQIKMGLLPDIHYDGSGEALNRLYEAVATLNLGGVEALVVMGDLVNATSKFNAKRLLREVEAVCEMFNGAIRYMPGNHDLDYLSKADFYSALGFAGDPSRFHFEIGDYTVICIDGNFSPDGSEYERGNFQWEESYIPKEQLDWLRGRLAASLLPVIVISHQRIDCPSKHAVQNHAAVREILANSGKVEAVFQGHRHEDDLKRIDEISYYTLGAHLDGAGPAVATLGGRSIQLVRDYQLHEEVVP